MPSLRTDDSGLVRRCAGAALFFEPRRARAAKAAVAAAPVRITSID
jgi:hypothetical protein